MAQLRAPLSSVKEWKRKSTELYDTSNDCLASLLSRGFESMSFLLTENADRNNIRRSLLNLDSERKNSMQFEDSSHDNIRNVMYGYVEASHSTFLHLTEKVDSLQEENEILKARLELLTKSDEVPNSDATLAMAPKDEKVDVSHAIQDSNEMVIPIYPDTGLTFKQEDMLDDDMKYEVEEENVLVENAFNEQPPDRTMSDFGFMEDDIPLQEQISDGIENQDFSYEVGDVEGAPQSEKFSDADVMRNIRRSSRILKDLTMKESIEDSDEDGESKVKRKRIDRNSSVRVSHVDSTERTIAKRSETEIACHLCEFRTRIPMTCITHLKRTHSTTLVQEGLAFLCECGNESQSQIHSQKCDISNFTVIKKTQVLPTTPQCVMCEAYPKTVFGYITHLSKLHKTTLRANGIYLICSCGEMIRSNIVHGKECDGREFSLHKIDEEK